MGGQKRQVGSIAVIVVLALTAIAALFLFHVPARLGLISTPSLKATTPNHSVAVLGSARSEATPSEPAVAPPPSPADTKPRKGYRVVTTTQQAERIDGNGRVSREEAIISSVACNAGQQIYVFEYPGRAMYRAVVSPNRMRPLGGQEFATFGEAAAAGCSR